MTLRALIGDAPHASLAVVGENTTGRVGPVSQGLMVWQHSAPDRDINIERGRRLVGDDQPGLVNDGLSIPYALAHAAGGTVCGYQFGARRSGCTWTAVRVRSTVSELPPYHCRVGPGTPR